MSSLSTFDRKNILATAAGVHFDAIIIGGGITGAGIALDAAARGMKVLLLEKYDFAGGTSSKSTKLIHGGLRYLKQLELQLVREVGRERAVIHRLAPHLVHPVNMLLPVYENGSLGKFTTSLALQVYDRLAGVKKEDRYRYMSQEEALRFEPLLNHNGLKGAAVYKEYQTDDTRLTMAVIKTAVQYGAVCVNYAGAESFLHDENKNINGITARDLLNNEVYSFHAKAVINAAGPWVDAVRQLEAPVSGKKLQLTKGVHIVVPFEKLPLQHAVYFDVPEDNRMIFAIPRDNIIYIGTTDTFYNGEKENIAIDRADVEYLLRAANHIFPSASLKMNDVISGWAGLRPLIGEEGKSPSELSRKDEIFIGASGLISIAGGKLTGYRKMAEKVISLVAKRIAYSSVKKINTAHIQLSGAAFNMPVDEFVERRTGEAKQIGLNKNDIIYLVKNYGADADAIIQVAFELYHQQPDARTRLLEAEIQYGAENEMTATMSDYIIRRTGRLYFDRPALVVEMALIREIFTRVLRLDTSESQMQFDFANAALLQAITYH